LSLVLLLLTVEQGALLPDLPQQELLAPLLR
jgi:hypothetical protein